LYESWTTLDLIRCNHCNSDLILIIVTIFRDRIVTGSFDKTAMVWCSQTGHCLATMWGHDAEVVVVKFSPTRCELATGSIDATSKIFHAETGISKILRCFLITHDNSMSLDRMTNLKFTSDVTRVGLFIPSLVATQLLTSLSEWSF